MSKVILITGCSSGIGWHAALQLHQKGYRVFASARKAADVEKLRAAGLVDSLQLDVDDSGSIHAALETLLQKTNGVLDAVFNNAGYAIPGAVEDLTRDLMQKQFETNVFGAMELTNAIIPIMRKQGSGRIIQNTSILGSIAMPFRGAYNASKFALEGFSNTLRLELRHSPIKVSIIAPGPIQTEFRKNAMLQYESHLQGKPSAFSNRYRSMQHVFSTPPAKTEALLTETPDAVVKALLHALESPRPKAHYYIGSVAKGFALLKRILPDWILDWIIDQSLSGER